MGRIKIAVGQDDFADMCNNKSYYVDKTEILDESDMRNEAYE